MYRTLIAIAIVELAALAVVAMTAQDPAPAGWPQWGGPHRNFRVPAATVPHTWGEDGPTPLWRRSLGEGYSSIIAGGDLLFTMYREDDDEVVVALDAATGATRWQHAYHAPLLHDGYFDVWLNSAGPGPYSSPLLADGSLFTIGVNGHLHALDAGTGALRWSHNLVDAFDLDDYNAFASSPIAYGENIIQPLGGSGRGVVAFDRQTGAVAWRSPDFDLAPGSPLLIDGRRPDAAGRARPAGGGRPRSAGRPAAVEPSPRERARPQHQRAAVGARQHAVRLLGVRRR